MIKSLQASSAKEFILAQLNIDQSVDDQDEKYFMQRIIKAKYEKIHNSNLKALIERLTHLVFLIIICADIFSNYDFKPGRVIGSSIYCFGFAQRFLWCKYIKREYHTPYKKVSLDGNFYLKCLGYTCIESLDMLINHELWS